MTSNLALRNLANEEFAVKVESSNAIGEPIAQARALNSMKHWAEHFMSAFSPGSSLWVRRGKRLE